MTKLNGRGFAHEAILVVFVVLFAIVGVGYLVASHADQASVAVTTPAGPNPCAAPVTLKSVENVDSAGHVVGAARSGAQANLLQSNLAKRYDYNVGGSVVEQMVPPAGWSPLAAGAQELQTYGFPARPTNPTALSHWQAMLSAYKGSGAPGLCATNMKSTLVTGAYSDNWAGAIALNNIYNQNLYTSALGEWSQTAIKATCGPNAQYATWTGIGGIASHFPAIYDYTGGTANGGLIQDGTDYFMYGGKVPVDFAWYEAISYDHPFPMIAFSGSGNAIKPGDQVYSAVSYSPSNGTANFLVVDATKHIGWGAGNVPGVSYNGQYAPMSSFYDGNTADFIAEPPTNLATNSIYPLAQPYLGNTYYYVADANGTPISSLRSATITQTSNSPGNPIVDSSSFNGQGAWYDYWQRCL